MDDGDEPESIAVLIAKPLGKSGSTFMTSRRQLPWQMQPYPRYRELIAHAVGEPDLVGRLHVRVPLRRAGGEAK